MTLNDICSDVLRWVPYSAIISWEQIQRPTTRHYIESETLGHRALNEISPPNPSHLSSENAKEEESEGVVETEGMEDTRRTRSSKTIEQRSCELTVIEAAITGPTWVCIYTIDFSLILLLSG